jgi:hypothetical protein
MPPICWEGFDIGIQTQVLEALRLLVAQTGGMAADIGALPAGEGLALAVTTGRETGETLAQGVTVVLDVALTMKHGVQQTALDTLCRVHEALRRADPLPAGEGWQVTAIRTGGAPGYLDRDGDFWLYGGALAVGYAAD